MAIPVYQEQGVQGGGTVKLSGSNPVNQALQGLGGSLMDAASVANAYAEKSARLKRNAAVADYEAAFETDSARIANEARKKTEVGELTFEEAKEWQKQEIDGFRDRFISQANYDKETLATIDNDFKVRSARAVVTGNASWDKKIRERQVFQIVNAVDGHRRNEILYRMNGDETAAESYRALADERLEGLRGIVDDAEIEKIRQEGVYSSALVMLNETVNPEDTDDVKKWMENNSERLSPGQISDLGWKIARRKDNLEIEQKRMATEDKRQKKDYYDEQQTRSLAVNERPISPIEADQLREQGLIGDSERMLARVKWAQYQQEAVTEAQKKNGETILYDVSRGAVRTHREVYAKVIDGSISLKDAYRAEAVLSESIAKNTSPSEQRQFNKIRTNYVKRETATIDQLNDTLSKIENDEQLTIDERIQQTEAILSLYSLRKDPAMSDAMFYAHKKLLDMGNMIRKYDPTFQPDAFANKIFSNKMLKMNPDMVQAELDRLTKQYQSILDGALIQELSGKTIGVGSAPDAGTIDFNNLQ